jgi:hypothetical protein
VFGRLESPWPVNGSVLVQDGNVYCVAGRSMHLDSGLYFYVLDLATGEVLQQTNLQADTGPKGEVKGAVLPDLLVSDGNDIYMRQMRFDAQDISQHRSATGGGFLRVNDGGLLDHTWINNNFWRFGPAQGQMLAFDEETAFCIRGVSRLISKSYGQDIFSPGKEGYQLYAVDLRSNPGSKRADVKDKRRGKRGRSGVTSKWGRRVSVRAQCMVVTDTHLLIAGIPDTADRDDPWAAFEGRKGGIMEVYAKADGEKLAEYRLEKPPVYDGLAAANSRVYLATTDGRVVCFAGQR